MGHYEGILSGRTIVGSLYLVVFNCILMCSVGVVGEAWVVLLGSCDILAIGISGLKCNAGIRIPHDVPMHHQWAEMKRWKFPMEIPWEIHSMGKSMKTYNEMNEIYEILLIPCLIHGLILQI